MNDTPPAVEHRYRALFLECTGEERLRMGCSMHATARALVIAGIRQRRPDATPTEIRRALFLAFYGRGFAPAEHEKVFRALALAGGTSAPATRS